MPLGKTETMSSMAGPKKISMTKYDELDYLVPNKAHRNAIREAMSPSNIDSVEAKPRMLSETEIKELKFQANEYHAPKERMKWIKDMLGEGYQVPEGTFDDILDTIKTREKPSGLGKAVGAFSKVAGGLARGLAEAPAYEFVSPPSAGPSDPKDPVYQFERGLISEEEFLRKMGK